MRQIVVGAVLFMSSVLVGGGLAWGQAVSIGTVSADITVTNSATLVKAGNASRETLSCANNHATVNVRWGASDVTATGGQRIPAGATIEIKNRAPVYMISEGTDVVVSCTEETR